jgi:hypothetical protein
MGFVWATAYRIRSVTQCVAILKYISMYKRIGILESFQGIGRRSIDCFLLNTYVYIMLFRTKDYNARDASHARGRILWIAPLDEESLQKYTTERVKMKTSRSIQVQCGMNKSSRNGPVQDWQTVINSLNTCHLDLSVVCWLFRL